MEMTNEYKAMLFDKMMELAKQKYLSESARAEYCRNSILEYTGMCENSRRILERNELRADGGAAALADLILEMTGVHSWEIDNFCADDHTHVNV